MYTITQSYGSFSFSIKIHLNDSIRLFSDFESEIKSRSESIETGFSLFTQKPDELEKIHWSKFRCCSNGNCSVYFSIVSHGEKSPKCLRCKHEFKDTDVISDKNQYIFGNLTCTKCDKLKSQLYGEFVPNLISDNRIIHYFICDDCTGINK